MRPLGWAPIQSDWCPYKRKFGYTKRHQGCKQRKGFREDKAQKARHAPENHEDQAERQQNHERPMHGLGETEAGSY